MTGHDGKGSNDETFVSNSGRVVLEPRDFRVGGVFKRSKKPWPVGHEVTWKAYAMAIDTYAPEKTDDTALVRRITLAQGLTNGKHVLEIIPNGDGPVPIRQIVVHRPPLK